MNRWIAAFAVASCALLASADVVVPGQERRPRPAPRPVQTDTTGTVSTATTGSTTTSTTTSATTSSDAPSQTATVAETSTTPSAPGKRRTSPVAWFIPVGVVLVVVLAARRRKTQQP